MVTASSREALRRALVGIAVEIQGTDPSEVAYETGELLLTFFPDRVLKFLFFLPVLEKAQRLGN